MFGPVLEVLNIVYSGGNLKEGRWKGESGDHHEHHSALDEEVGVCIYAA